MESAFETAGHGPLFRFELFGIHSQYLRQKRQDRVPFRRRDDVRLEQAQAAHAFEGDIGKTLGLLVCGGSVAQFILLVEFANQQCEQHGLTRREAIIATAKVRLRPILMTAAAVALGVVPLIIASGARAPPRAIPWAW